MLTMIFAAALAAAPAPSSPTANAPAQPMPMGEMDHSKMDHGKMAMDCCKKTADGKMECNMPPKAGSGSTGQSHSNH